MKLCGLCKDIAVCTFNHQWLCQKHYRFRQMRTSSKIRGKSVPTIEELAELTTSQDGRCADCKTPMNWLREDGPSTMATIQHYRNGTIALVCLSCNVRHAFMPDDSFRNVPANHKYCPRCKVVLPFSSFTKDAYRNSKLKLKSFCKSCCAVYVRALKQKKKISPFTFLTNSFL